MCCLTRPSPTPATRRRPCPLTPLSCLDVRHISSSSRFPPSAPQYLADGRHVPRRQPPAHSSSQVTIVLLLSERRRQRSIVSSSSRRVAYRLSHAPWPNVAVLMA